MLPSSACQFTAVQQIWLLNRSHERFWLLVPLARREAPPSDLLFHYAVASEPFFDQITHPEALKKKGIEVVLGSFDDIQSWTVQETAFLSSVSTLLPFSKAPKQLLDTPTISSLWQLGREAVFRSLYTARWSHLIMVLVIFAHSKALRTSPSLTAIPAIQFLVRSQDHVKSRSCSCLFNTISILFSSCSRIINCI